MAFKRHDQYDRLDEQIRFLLEIDQVKRVQRRSNILDRSRRENSAEHSWHVAVMAWLLAEHARVEVDLFKVIKMLLIHDIVEIDAGDTFLYDNEARKDQKEREEKAAVRIFGMLNTDQREEFEELWREFEARETVEARFAAAIDRLQPLLANYYTEGSTWKKYGVAQEDVVKRTKHISDGSPILWEYVEMLIQDAVAKGYLFTESDGEGV